MCGLTCEKRGNGAAVVERRKSLSQARSRTTRYPTAATQPAPSGVYPPWPQTSRTRRGRTRTAAIAGFLTVALTGALVEAPATPALAARPSQAAPKPACPADRPDKTAALVTARLCGGQVGITAYTNEYDQAWALPNGSVRWEHRYRPVRVQRDGDWVAVDATLQASSDSTVRPVATAVDLAFSGGGNGPLVSVGEGKTTLKVGSPS
jgi:hypothetical protein